MLKTSGRAQLVEEHQGKHNIIKDIRVQGDLSTSPGVALRALPRGGGPESRASFDFLYRPLGTDAGNEELSVTAAEAEIGYYQGEGVLLEERCGSRCSCSSVEGTCRDDCKGLCPAAARTGTPKLALARRWAIRAGKP